MPNNNTVPPVLPGQQRNPPQTPAGGTTSTPPMINPNTTVYQPNMTATTGPGVPTNLNGRSQVQGQDRAMTSGANGADDARNGGLNVLTNQDVANAFINPDSASLRATIANGPTNNVANQAVSPLAGITTLGNAATVNPNNINTAQSNNILTGQLQNINQLNNQAQGIGPSVAMQSAQQLADQNIANTMGAIASQRGASNPGLGLRNALTAKAAADQQAVQAGTLGRTQEMMNAQNALSSALNGTQGQVMQGAQAQSQLNNQNNLANQAASNANQLQQGTMNQQTAMQNNQTQAQTTLANLAAKQQTQGLNAQEYNNMLQAAMTLSGNDQVAAENYVNAMISQNLSQQDINKSLAINAANNQMGLLGAGIGGAAALGAAAINASDRNLKKNISSANRSIKDFLTQIAPSTSKFNLMEA